MPAKPKPRVPLTRERILAAALAIADAQGVSAVSMRTVAEALGVKAMSLYNHVANKDAILDGLVDAVFARIEVPTEVDWATAMRTRARTMHEALRTHPWAIGLLDARRSPGATTLQHHDTTIGVLRRTGFSAPMVSRVLALLDAYVYGFALQERSLPMKSEEDVPALAREFLASGSVTSHPHLAWLAAEHAASDGVSFASEFDAGLDLVLEGIERRVSDDS